MHEIEPYDNWQHLYLAEEDENSPFFGLEHSEFTFSNTVYNYYIHPQWDNFGSNTLYLRVLYADYEKSFVIIQFIGEWNDAVENDIMELKRSVIDRMIESGITKFILILENVLNFHAGDDSYYEEWIEDLEGTEGWVAFLNTPAYERSEFHYAHVDHYCFFVEYEKWRTLQPEQVFQLVEDLIYNPKKNAPED